MTAYFVPFTVYAIDLFLDTPLNPDPCNVSVFNVTTSYTHGTDDLTVMKAIAACLHPNESASVCAELPYGVKVD